MKPAKIWSFVSYEYPPTTNPITKDLGLGELGIKTQFNTFWEG